VFWPISGCANGSLLSAGHHRKKLHHNVLFNVILCSPKRCIMSRVLSQEFVGPGCVAIPCLLGRGLQLLQLRCPARNRRWNAPSKISVRPPVLHFHSGSNLVHMGRNSEKTWMQVVSKEISCVSIRTIVLKKETACPVGFVSMTVSVVALYECCVHVE